MTFIYSILTFIEILYLIFALTSYFSSKGYRPPDSFVYSTIIALATYSVLIQIFFILGIWKYFYLIDISIVAFSIFIIRKNWNEFKSLKKIIQTFAKSYKIYIYFFTIIFTYLFLQAFLLPPYNWDSMTYNLARVLIFQNDNTLFLNNYTTIRQVIFPYGYDILHFMYLRFYSDFGVATFGFLCYFTIVLSTYSIVKKYFNDTKYALFITFILSSFSQFILQATNTKNDIPLAAITVVIILAAMNYFKNNRLIDIYIILIAAVFGLSIKSYYPAFALPFIVIFTAYILHNKKLRLNFVSSLKEWKNNKTYILLLFSLLMLIVLFYYHNYLSFGGISGPIEYLSQNVNTDGVIGGIVNIGRYCIQLVNFPTEFFGKAISDFANNNLFLQLKSINANSLFNQPPILSSTAIADEGQTFYGVIANILIFPALIYSFVKGNMQIRIIVLSLLIFFLAISFGLKWDTWRTRFLISFFSGAGICYAILLYKIYLKNGFLKKLLILVVISNVAFVMFFNANKPFPYVNETIQYALKILNINRVYARQGSWVNWAFNRDYNYDYFYGDKGTLKECSQLIEDDSDILFLGSGGSWVFPVFLRMHNVKYFIANDSLLFYNNDFVNVYTDNKFILEKFKYILIQKGIESKFRGYEEIFSSEGKHGRLKIFQREQPSTL